MKAARTELELKLLAPRRLSDSVVISALRDAGAELAAPRKQAQLDRYLDTPSLDLARRGVGLRLRELAGGATLGVKLRGQPEQALWRRLELEAPHPDGAPPPELAGALPEALRDAVEPLALGRPLEEKVCLETQRTSWRLRMPGYEPHAVLCVDRVLARGAEGRRTSFVEVEVESLDGDAEALAACGRALQERAGLVASASDKLERALGAFGVTLVPPPQRSGLEPDLPLRRAAARVLALHLEALQQAEPAARRGEDAEGVHRMRVATRRTRAAFRLFRRSFGERALGSALRLFRRTGRELGGVRDLDVLLGQLPELAREIPPALAEQVEPLAGMLRERRRHERERLLAWLRAPERLRAAERYHAFLERAATTDPRRGEAARRLGDAAPELLRAAASRVLRRGERIRRDSPPELLHGLRIDVKRLRYTAEAFSELYGAALAPLLRRTTKLQDVLGAYNDAQVGAVRLAAWCDTAAGRELPRGTLLAVGAMLAALDERAHAARADFKEAWKDFDRRSVRRALERLPGA